MSHTVLKHLNGSHMKYKCTAKGWKNAKNVRKRITRAFNKQTLVQVLNGDSEDETLHKFKPGKIFVQY